MNELDLKTYFKGKWQGVDKKTGELIKGFDKVILEDLSGWISHNGVPESSHYCEFR